MNPNPLAHLAHRPLAILPTSIVQLRAALRRSPLRWRRRPRQPLRRAADGGATVSNDGDTAIIGILTPLVTDVEGQGWGTTSYEYLARALEAAARDTKVKHSPRSRLAWRPCAGHDGIGGARVRRINAEQADRAQRERLWRAQLLTASPAPRRRSSRRRRRRSARSASSWSMAIFPALFDKAGISPSH